LGRITVGRASSNDVVLVEPSVSNHHAWFSKDPQGGLTIQDAGSKNGTTVDGRRIDSDEVVWVQPMDQIKFGSLSTFTCMPGVLRGVLKTLETEGEL
jgi:pSer/pThr/pTyr-binding forkhead associated (FHA) protein